MRYHYDYYGNPGKCIASIKCPYGFNIETEHFDSMEEARAAFEKTMYGKIFKVLKKITKNELFLPRIRIKRKPNDLERLLMNTYTKDIKFDLYSIQKYRSELSNIDFSDQGNVDRAVILTHVIGQHVLSNLTKNKKVQDLIYRYTNVQKDFDDWDKSQDIKIMEKINYEQSKIVEEFREIIIKELSSYISFGKNKLDQKVSVKDISKSEQSTTVIANSIANVNKFIPDSFVSLLNNRAKIRKFQIIDLNTFYREDGKKDSYYSREKEEAGIWVTGYAHYKKVQIYNDSSLGHELMHRVEDLIPNINKTNIRVLNLRTRFEGKQQKLKKVKGLDVEKARYRPLGFSNPYASRDYSVDGISNATDILSIGFESTIGYPEDWLLGNCDEQLVSYTIGTLILYGR